MCLAYILANPQAQEVAEKALQTNPYNAVAYGVLVAVLILAVIFLWREYKNALERRRKVIDKAIGLIQLVETKLEAVEDLESETNQLRGEVQDLENRVGQLSEYINLLRGNESD